MSGVEEIHDRLRLIFPEGTSHRNYCIREMAAKTILSNCSIRPGNHAPQKKNWIPAPGSSPGQASPE